MTRFAVSVASVIVFLLHHLVSPVSALDLEFESITCDTALPAFAYDSGIQVTCSNGNGGRSHRCTLGQTLLIQGRLHYNNLSSYFPYDEDNDDDEVYDNSNNVTKAIAYASADLNLATLEYGLFSHLPFNFCGDWVSSYQGHSTQCPQDDTYTFQVSYVLPSDEFDMASWFATGWRGTSDVVIYDQPDAVNGQQLMNCRLRWSTYVTSDSSSEGWATFPSAARVAIALASTAGFMILCCIFMSCCCQSDRSKHQITDEEYAKTFQVMDDDDASLTDREEDEEQLRKIARKRRNKTVDRRSYWMRRLNGQRRSMDPDWDYSVSMKYPALDD